MNIILYADDALLFISEPQFYCSWIFCCPGSTIAHSPILLVPSPILLALVSGAFSPHPFLTCLPSTSSSLMPLLSVSNPLESFLPEFRLEPWFHLGCKYFWSKLRSCFFPAGFRPIPEMLRSWVECNLGWFWSVLHSSSISECVKGAVK